VGGSIAIPAVKIKKLVARSVSLVVVKRARRDQSILDAAQPQQNAKATSVEAPTFKRKV
jgi:hypothetical protein